MLRSLNVRLLLSYVAVILVCLVLVGLGLFVFVRTSPLWNRMGTGIVRLEVATRTAMPIIAREMQNQPTAERAVAALSQIAERQEEIRILALDSDGRVRYDSLGAWEGLDLSRRVRPRQLAASSSPTPSGTFNGPDGEDWAYVAGTVRLRDDHPLFILFTSPVSRGRLLVWFAQNLLPSLIEAGLVALILSLILAWLMARSVARPLQEVAVASRALARGDLERRAPVSGPQEVQELARAFNQMATRVAASQQSQRDFLANVSHELKTPLTSIQGFSQAILDGTAGDPEAVTRAAHVIHDEADRMRRMVDGLLSLARFDADQVEMDREPVDLAALLQRCVTCLGPQAEAAGDELTLSTEGSLVVTGDADWLTQVFINLLDNAIRHTQDGEVGVIARCAGDEIEVTVTDTGEGIPPEALDRIFERFYRADAARQREGGVGLGLPIVQEVVWRHGGEVTVESVVDLGSRFTVRLPARQE
jgi:signal transduction histidine kinase